VGHQEAQDTRGRGQSQTTAAAEAARALFDVPDHIVYLNCANLAPRLRSVAAAGHAGIDRLASPWTIRSSDWFQDSARLGQLFAGLIGASAASVTIVPSVSYAIAVAARNVPVAAGDNIVVVAREYPSNYYSWRRLAQERGAEIRAATTTQGASLTDSIASLIDRNTAVVAIPNCHWTDGSLIDLSRIGEVARKFRAALVVDASQSLGACPLDVADCQPDFLVSVGYKWLLGPYGLAYLYVADRWHGNGVPLEESWLHREGSDDFARLVDYTDAYKPGAERFGQGESAQFCLLPMAIAALSQIAAWTPAHIQDRLRAWTNELAARARSIGLQCPAPKDRLGHLIGLRSQNALPADLASALAERDIFVAVRGNSIRVSPHLHSRDGDIEMLINALEELIR
jgi:selenocysteine lyase/cysteine desulfurase